MRKVVIVDNTCKHVLHIVNLRKKTEARMHPGYNQIPADAWEHLKEEQNVQDRIDNGTIRVVREEEHEVDVSFYLQENAARARKVAKEMSYDGAVMQEWLDQETRPSIRLILEKRLAEGKKTKKEK